MFVCPFFSPSASTISGSGIQRHQDISGCAVGQAQGWPGAPWLLHLLQGDGHRGMANSQQQTSDLPAVSAALLCSAQGPQGPTCILLLLPGVEFQIKKELPSVTHTGWHTQQHQGLLEGSGLLQGWFVHPELAAKAECSAQSLRHQQIHIPWLCCVPVE